MHYKYVSSWSTLISFGDFDEVKELILKGRKNPLINLFLCVDQIPQLDK